MTDEDSSLSPLTHQGPRVDGGAPALLEGGISFRYIVAAIRSNLTLIWTMLLAATALAVIVTLLQTPRYRASSSIQINNTSNHVLKSDEQNDEDSVSSTDTDLFLKTQVGILESKGLALRVVQRLNLMTNQKFYASQGKQVPTTAMAENERHDQVIKMISKNLEVKMSHDSRIATITYESNDPQVSAEIANAYASEFIQMNLKRKFDSSSYARDFLSGQLQQTKQKLEESEKALNGYARQAGIIRIQGSSGDSDGKSSNSGGQSVTTASLLQLNQAANEAKARRIAAEARWHSINSGPLLSSSEVMGNAGMGQMLTQLATIQSALSEDRARHLEDYPTVKAKEQSLAALNKQIQLSAANIRNGIKSEYDAAVATERDLVAQVEAAKSSTLNEQDSNVQFGLLAREVDTNRQVYDGLLQRFKELNASAGITISNIAIIDAAEAPLHPSSPDIVRNLAVGVVLGIVLVIIIVAIKDQFDDSIRIPEEIESKLDLPLLGVVPRVNKSDPGEELTDPKSSVSEAYNSLRGALLYSTPDGMPSVMLVTSAQPSEGKTTTSFAIASGFARIGKRVILFDADMRRPAIHRMIDSENARGLSTLLVTNEQLASVVHPTSQENLFVVTSGPVPPSPTELISGSRMREIIAHAATQYDIVLIDSPPVLGLADAPTMSAIVDGVIFVVEADRSRHGSLKTALRRLRGVRRNILGGVLTKFDPLRSGNRYSSYYGYEYYQYSYHDDRV